MRTKSYCKNQLNSGVYQLWIFAKYGLILGLDDSFIHVDIIFWSFLGFLNLERSATNRYLNSWVLRSNLMCPISGRAYEGV